MNAEQTVELIRRAMLDATTIEGRLSLRDDIKRILEDGGAWQVEAELRQSERAHRVKAEAWDEGEAAAETNHASEGHQEIPQVQNPYRQHDAYVPPTRVFVEATA